MPYLGIYENQANNLYSQKRKLMKLLWKRLRFLGRYNIYVYIERHTGQFPAAHFIKSIPFTPNILFMQVLTRGIWHMQ